MAKNTIYLDVVVDDNGTTRRVAVDSTRLADAMSRTARNSAEADRNIKGAAQASSNATKNFSKMSQGMGGLVAAYATIAAQVFALSAAYQFLLQAADFRILIEGQKALTQQTGVAYTSITKSIQSATDAQLGYKQAAQAAAIGTAAGLSATMLKDIASYSQTISAVLGRDLEDTFNRLIRGITKAEPELLDELGIVLRLADATSEYARTIGKTANELTAYERTQGVALFTLKQAEEKYGDLNKAGELSANGIRQLGAAFSELANKILPEIAGVAEFLANSIRGNVAAVASTFGLLLAGVVGQILPSAEDITRRTDAALEKYSNKIADYTIQADAFARGQLTITKRVQPAVDSLKGLASSIQRIQGAKASPFLADIMNIGERFDPRQVTTMQDRIEAELTRRQAGARGRARDTLFVGIRDEQLREFSSKLGVMTTEAQKASEGMSGAIQTFGTTAAATATRTKLIWASTMRTIQVATLGAVRVMNAAFKALGAIGLFLTLFELAKSVYSYLSEKFAKQDLVEKSLAEQVVGSGKEADAAKARIEDLERAGKGLESIRLKGTFEEISAFSGNMSGNIKDVVDRLKQETSSYANAVKSIQAEIESLQKKSNDITAQLSQGDGFYTKVEQAQRISLGTVRTQVNTDLVKQQTELNAISDTSIKNLLLEARAYAKNTPELQQYAKELENLNNVTDYTSATTTNALEAISNFASNANQSAAAIKAFSEGFKTLNKEVIDSSALEATQKRYIQLNSLIINLGDAFIYSRKNGTLSGNNLRELSALGTEFTRVLGKVRVQLDNAFNLKVQEQNLNRLATQLQLFFSQSDAAIELLNEQDIQKTQLEIAKINDQLNSLEVNKELFDIFTNQNQIVLNAALRDEASASILAAGATNADKLAEKFTESSDGFISKYEKENDGFLTRLAKINRTQAPEREVPAAIEEVTVTARRIPTAADIQEVQVTAMPLVDRNAEQRLRNQNFERERSLLEQRKLQFAITQTITNEVQAARRFNEYKAKQIENAKEIQSLETQILNTNVSLEDKLENQTQFALDNLMYGEQQLDLVRERNRAAEAGIQTEIASGTVTGDRLQILNASLVRLREINTTEERRLELQNELNALQQEEELRQTRLAILKEQTDAANNLLDIQQELNSLRNPYLQEEANERLNILRIQEKILDLERQARDPRQEDIPRLLREIALEKTRLGVLQQQASEVFKISQAAQGAFGEGLQQEIANFLKGGEVDIENSFLNIIKSVGEAAADQLSQSITESIMGGLGFQTDAEKLQSAITLGSEYGAQLFYNSITSAGQAVAQAPGAVPTTPGGVPTADPAVTASRSIGKDLRNFGTNVKETFASDAPFLDKLGSIFSADAPWINSMTRGLAGALGGLAVGALGGGGGNAWRNAIIGGVVSGLSFGFSSWLGGLGSAAPAASGAVANTAIIRTSPKLVSSTPYTSSISPFGMASGGIAMGGFRAFANGGVVNKPTLGLVGEGRYNEAVVPLPDGKSIPVIMQSGGGDRNNIGININVNSNGQMQGDAQATGERGVAMAQAIQNVVQLELKRQKRPGGLLSPF